MRRIVGMKRILFTIALGVILTGRVAAADVDDAEFFEAKIRPLLVERCYACHSGAKKQEGGLSLDSRSGWQKGGDSGPALVSTHPEKSLLMLRVREKDRDAVMPPNGAGKPLTSQQIADLDEWIKRGAYDPRDDASLGTRVAADWETEYRNRLNWWSLKPVLRVAAPEVADSEWSQSSVDRFLRLSMRQRDVEPAPAADPLTLLRRASLVLTGLPPSLQQVAEFQGSLSTDGDRAYEKLIDRLLNSPQFGERFARHWLDVVRFSETHGNEWNYDAAYAWRYRDYVIRAFNTDVPYDRFVREQLAGDLLSTPRRSEGIPYNESPLGTAFYRFGEVNHDSCTQFPVIGYDILDNQLDTLTKAFQATTAACARCHDHKLDAISQKDYYSLLAVLRSSRPIMRTLDAPDLHQHVIASLQDLKRELRNELVSLWSSEAHAISPARLDSLLNAAKDQSLPPENPLHPWSIVRKADNIAETWSQFGSNLSGESAARGEFNRTHFTTLADFREEIPAGWLIDGHGLRQGVVKRGDFLPATEGDAAIKSVLPAGLMTYAVSDRLNGALRSPKLRRSHSKISFEVQGGRFSLARLVFNNCQFNYDRQHSIHHDAWSWITIDWPDQTDQLNPYVELLTFWDNPKFPDPLGTLGKDVEVQREPFDVHSRNPRSWWGVRQIVLHNVGELPKATLSHLDRLLAGETPESTDSVAGRYAYIAHEVIERFGTDKATDDDIVWLDWLIRSGLLSNRSQASPRLSELLARYREVESTLPPANTFPGMADESEPVSQPVFARGDLQKPRDAVERGYLKMLTPDGMAVSTASSGRRELAEVIASSSNPLTARVMVNRVWLWLFGRGLVGTPDDFGHLGELPSHPELLDYLADRFVAEGWSVKKLIRELVMTRAFRSSGRPTESALRLDPQNLTCSHFTSRWGEAEVVRDSLLAVSGQLDLKQYGPSVHPYRSTADNEKRLFAGPLDGDGRRSIYIKFQLMEQPAFLRAFNLPGGKVSEGRRGSSHTVEQSLAMLNDPLVLALSDRWAGDLLRDGALSVEARVRSMFVRSLSREPSMTEVSRFQAAIQEYRQARGISPEELLTSHDVWREVAHTLFNLQEFRFIP